MAETVKRLYSLEDEVVITRALVSLKHLQDHLALFTARFPWFDINYVNSFQADIDAAKNASPDDGVRALKKVLTEDVTDTVEQSYAALSKLGDYARVAYPADRERRTVFGQGRWGAARNNHQLMYEALRLAHEMATTEPYKTDLNNKGYTAADAAELSTLADLLEQRRIPQQNAGQARKVTTADRVALFNALWQKMKTIKICASVVYQQDAMKRRIFDLYPAPIKKMTVLALSVSRAAMPVAGAVVHLANMKKPRHSDAKGRVVFKSRKMPAEVSGEVAHRDGTRTSFTVKIKAAQRNKVVVELA